MPSEPGGEVAVAERGEVSNVVLIADDHGHKHKHSGTLRACNLQVFGQPFEQTTLILKTATRVSELKETLGQSYNVDPEKIEFYVKDGNYFRAQREKEEIRSTVVVKGVRSFKRETVEEVKRSKWLPAWDKLPLKIKRLFPPQAPKMPQKRFFLFYGPGDGFAQWAHFLFASPQWLEVVIYEWPSHGRREEEPMPANLDGLIEDAMEGLKETLSEHAPGGQAANAPFVFLGHSVGALIMVGVAERMRSMFKIDPSAVFVLDRPPPHVGMCSDLGADMLRNDPKKFAQACQPVIKLINSSDEQEEQNLIRQWTEEIKLHEDTRPKGFHTFECPIYVAAASRNWQLDGEGVWDHLNQEQRDRHRQLDAIYASKSGSQAMFDRAAYDEWRDWTSEACTVIDFDADSMSLKHTDSFWWFVFDVIGKLKVGVQKEKPATDAEPKENATAIVA